VDSHVHLCLSGTRDKTVRQFQLNAPYAALEPAMRTHLNSYLLQGILGIRDGGDYGAHCLRFRMNDQSSFSSKVILRSAGRAWHAPGRYGRLLGRSPGGGISLGEALSRCAEPCDHLKIINSGTVSLKELGSPGKPQFGIDEIKYAVGIAHSRGLKVMVHANGEIPTSAAIEAGCDTIEHGFFAGKGNLERMAERQIFWIPTLFAMEALSMEQAQGSKEKEIALQSLKHQMEQVALANELGVPMALGSDSGSIGVDHGTSLGEEMRLFMEAGVAPEKIIHFAASNGARVLGVETYMGTLRSGMPSNILALPGSPSEIIREFSHKEKRLITSTSCR
jgi:imidazolonepropionase-like amidohydrolase